MNKASQKTTAINLLICGPIISAIAIYLFKIYGNNPSTLIFFFMALLFGVGVVLIFLGLEILITLAFLKPIGINSLLPNIVEERKVDGDSFKVYFQKTEQTKTSILDYFSQSDNDYVSFLHISIPSVCFTTIQLSKEIEMDRFGKEIGLAIEMQTGHLEFDNSVYINEKNPVFAKLFLDNAEVRNIILDLFRSGFSLISINKDSINALFPDYKPEILNSLNFPEQIARNLIALRKNLPTPNQEIICHSSPPKTFLESVLWLISLAYGSAGVLLFYYKSVYYWEFYKLGIVAYFLTHSLFAFSSALLLRGNSNSHITWLKINIPGVLLFALGSFGFIMGANVLLDNNAPIKRSLEIIRTDTNTKSKSPYVYVESPKYPGKYLKYPVDSHLFPQIIRNKSKVHSVTGKGFLSIEWEISADIEP